MENLEMTVLNLHASCSWKNAIANLCVGQAREKTPRLPAHDAPDASGNAKAWASVLAMLRGWQGDPAQRADEGVEAPSLSTIRAVIDVAERFAAQGIAPPDDVTSDADGGIILRRRQDDVSEEFQVSDDGIEYRCFAGTRLVERTACRNG
jgi:hypothetical protein